MALSSSIINERRSTIMKKIYSTPELIVVLLQKQDIVTASPLSMTLHNENDFVITDDNEVY